MVVKIRKFIKCLLKCLDSSESAEIVDTHGFVNEYNKFWLAHRSESDDIVMPYFDEDGIYVKYAVDDVVPVSKRDGMIAYYCIKSVGFYCSSSSDCAFWDDRKEYHLVFDHIINTE